MSNFHYTVLRIRSVTIYFLLLESITPLYHINFEIMAYYFRSTRVITCTAPAPHPLVLYWGLLPAMQHDVLWISKSQIQSRILLIEIKSYLAPFHPSSNLTDPLSLRRLIFVCIVAHPNSSLLLLDTLSIHLDCLTDAYFTRARLTDTPTANWSNAICWLFLGMLTFESSSPHK